MEIICAKTAGFCFGVRRAVDTVYEQIEKQEKPVYTYGPIIHNEQVVEIWKKKVCVWWKHRKNWKKSLPVWW